MLLLLLLLLLLHSPATPHSRPCMWTHRLL
jgi:hypothetical protein